MVLGTPPPPLPQPLTSPSSNSRRKAAPGPLNVLTQTQQSSISPKEVSYPTLNASVPSKDDEFIIVEKRNRTEAQELADFFNSEPPPGLVQDDEAHIEQLNTSKSKGFKGFISKVSLSSKKKDDDKYRILPPVKQHSQSQEQPVSSTGLSQLNSPTSAAQGRTMGGLWEVKKQKSTGNMMTGMQSSCRNDQSEPPLPPAPTAATGYSIPDFQQRNALPPRIQTPPKVSPISVQEAIPALGENTVHKSPEATYHQMIQSPFGAGSAEKIAGPDVAGVSLADPIGPANTSRERRIRLTSPKSNEKKPLVISKTTSITTATAFSTPYKNLSATPFESPGTGSSGGASSFTTANEGSGCEHSPMIARQNVNQGSKPEEQLSSEPNESTLNITASSGMPVGEFESQPIRLASCLKQTSESVASRDAVPKQDLVSLRNLLDHATSAPECCLLLNAILTQFGVPYSDLESCRSEEGKGKGKHTAIETPEDRVVAWLLAGREGPVGSHLPQPQVVVPVPVAEEESKKDGLSNTDQDQLITTPTQIGGAVLPSKFTCLFRNEDAVPPSATTTEFTTDGETLEIAGGQVEYVKTGERGGARLVEA